MEGARARWRCMLWKTALSRELLNLWYQVQPSRRQHRCVQHLANVARRFRAVVVRMEKGQTGRDIQQQYATQQS
jgi:hypothetical protein